LYRRVEGTMNSFRLRTGTNCWNVVPPAITLEYLRGTRGGG
jgi:hypothetical protein